MTETSVEFKEDRHETAEGVTDTMHKLSEGAELRTTNQEKPNTSTMYPCFSSKRWVTKTIIIRSLS